MYSILLTGSGKGGTGFMFSFSCVTVSVGLIFGITAKDGDCALAETLSVGLFEGVGIGGSLWSAEKRGATSGFLFPEFHQITVNKDW